jgi:hypothetical protein
MKIQKNYFNIFFKLKVVAISNMKLEKKERNEKLTLQITWS